MSLIQRMSRLFKADVHGILDSIEEPQAVLKQAVREMELSVLEEDKRVAQLDKRHQYLKGLEADSARALRELAAQVALALDSGNDELCRAFVRKRLEEESRSREIARALERTAQSREEAARRLAAMREQLEAMTRKMELFVSTEPAEAPFGAAGDADGIGARLERRLRSVTDEDVEVALLKLRQERQGKKES